MPCDGPNKEYAHKQADEVTDVLLELLALPHGTRRQGQLYALYRKLHIHTIREPRGPFAHNLKDDHAKAKAQLREAMRELFWVDACNGF